LFREQAMNGAQEKSKTSGSSPPGRSSLIQSRAQALEVLGLSNDATDADIEAAYKRLIQKLHPDHGGTEFLTKQLNAARDFLSNH
jgi:type IV secretion system protein VirD4